MNKIIPMRHLLLAILFSATAFVASAQKTISSAGAKDHIGDSVTICGKVTGGKYLQNAANGPTLLDVDGTYPNQQLTIVIFKADRDKLSYAPETKLLDQQVCVTGKIQEYKGKPQIVVHAESQLKIAGK